MYDIIGDIHGYAAQLKALLEKLGYQEQSEVIEIADEIWLAGRPAPGLMDYDLGFFDQTENRVEPVGTNPFAPKVLPMSSD
tara:strand:+ start:311 stop:553 length:243 start_codon:yes stop_codon:yes gene_type:complete